MRPRLALTVLALWAAALVAGPPENGTNPSAGDEAAIRGVIEAYRTAWLRGDRRGVLETLTPDAVLLPAHGASPVVGTAAITSYWWPADGPPTTITRLEITVEDIQGDGRLASVHGRDDVEWTQIDGATTRAHGHPGTYLNVMRKLPDGSWRISRHMWDDGPSR
jgi:uncharacterized protein (TIGR02246 family)